MRKQNIIVIVLFLVALVQCAMGQQFNESDKNVLIFGLGNITAGTPTNSPYLNIPQSIKIDAAYVVASGAVASNSTDYIEFKLYNGSNVAAAFTSSATAMVANTPVALTLSTTAAYLKAAALAVLSARVTHGGSGKAATGTALILHYHNAN